MPIGPGTSAESADWQAADLSDALEVAVDVDDAESMMDGGLSDEQIRDGGAMPHPMVMGECALQGQRPLEDVRRCGDHRIGGVHITLEKVVIIRGTRRVELLELTDRADVELPGEFRELTSDYRVPRTSRGALVEQPAGQRHISTEARMSGSPRSASVRR